MNQQQNTHLPHRGNMQLNWPSKGHAVPTDCKEQTSRRSVPTTLKTSQPLLPTAKIAMTPYRTFMMMVGITALGMDYQWIEAYRYPNGDANTPDFPDVRENAEIEMDHKDDTLGISITINHQPNTPSQPDEHSCLANEHLSSPIFVNKCIVFGIKYDIAFCQHELLEHRPVIVDSRSNQDLKVSYFAGVWNVHHQFKPMILSMILDIKNSADPEDFVQKIIDESMDHIMITDSKPMFSIATHKLHEYMDIIELSRLHPDDVLLIEPVDWDTRVFKVVRESQIGDTNPFPFTTTEPIRGDLGQQPEDQGNGLQMHPQTMPLQTIPMFRRQWTSPELQPLLPIPGLNVQGLNIEVKKNILNDRSYLS